MGYIETKRRDEALDIASTQARVRVVDITNETDELEGYGVIVNGKLHDTIFSTRSAAHNFREAMESVLPIKGAKS